jgi:hypothetical protein
VNDIVHILGVSKGCVLRILVKNGSETNIDPSKRHYQKVQIGELYSFVQKKKRKFGYCMLLILKAMKSWRVQEENVIKKTVKDHLKRLNGIDIDWFCTDIIETPSKKFYQKTT